jgi:K+-transporting ATPase ATPase C chain
MKELILEIRTALLATLCLAAILCGVYPLTVWIVAQGLFDYKADGSLLTRSGRVTGSRLISQAFTGDGYFHPRPSSAGEGHDAAASGGSNLGPTSAKLIETVRKRVADYRRENGLPSTAQVPADAVTASASGLDRHISVKNALLQAPRVARARNLSESTVLREIAAHTDGRDLGMVGMAGVNVLTLNLSLDTILR